MKPKFYILKIEGVEEVKHYVTPEPEELKNAQNAIGWGAKKGIVSLIKPVRTATTYWEL